MHEVTVAGIDDHSISMCRELSYRKHYKMHFPGPDSQIAQDYEQFLRLAEGRLTAADKALPLSHWIGTLGFGGVDEHKPLGQQPQVQAALALLAAALRS